MISRRAALASGLGAPLWPALAQAQAANPTLADFVRDATLKDAALSPDGRSIALLHEERSGEARSAFVIVFPIATPTQNRRRLNLGSVEVTDIVWAAADRLLVSILLIQTDTERPTDSFIKEAYVTRLRRLMTIGLEDHATAVMLSDRRDVHRVNFNLDIVADMLADDPEHILMSAFDPQSRTGSLFKVNVATGASVVVERGAYNSVRWFCLGGRPLVRWDLASSGETAQILVRAPGEAAWRLFIRIRVDDRSFATFSVLAGTEHPDVLLVAYRGEGDEQVRTSRLNLRTLQMTGGGGNTGGHDVEGAFVDQHGVRLATRYTEDRVAYDFTEPDMAAHFRGLNSFFGGECNVRLLAIDDDRSHILLGVSGPRVPGAYFIYDKAVRRTDALGFARPWLPRGRLATVECLDVKTRDGADLRAYLTAPPGQGPRPLIVMPHGGPEVRDRFDFDPIAQAFASQGWLVLQPNFRGSGGYGRAFADAGRRRWGDRMQEDVEECVAQVIATGRANRDKVAIFGASYGGYAALMGAVRRPELYKAAVSVSGVSDLIEMMKFERKDGSDDDAYRYWLNTIGDPATEEARLVAASPRRRAGEIAVPVLLVHGLKDHTVPIAQSKMMQEALKRAGKPVEYLQFDDVGHNGWPAETRIQMVEKAASFIAAAFR